MDVAGGGVLGDHVAHLWDLGGPTPMLTETVPVMGGKFSFAEPIPSDMLGITVTAVEATPGDGLDFRSGAVAKPSSGSPPLRLELLLGPTITLTSDDIARWLSGVTIPPRRASP
jgi:hypothetical protein